jgi:hypothetical protein
MTNWFFFGNYGQNCACKLLDRLDLAEPFSQFSADAGGRIGLPIAEEPKFFAFDCYPAFLPP